MPRKRARPVREGVVGKGANTATSPATYFTSRPDLWGRAGEIPARYPAAMRKRRPFEASGGDREGERKRFADDVSKLSNWHRNRGVNAIPG